MTTLADVRKLLEGDPSREFSVNDHRDKLVGTRPHDRPWISPSAVSQALRLLLAEGAVKRRRGVVGQRSAGPGSHITDIDVLGYLYRWVLPPRSGWCDGP